MKGVWEVGCFTVGYLRRAEWRRYWTTKQGGSCWSSLVQLQSLSTAICVIWFTFMSAIIFFREEGTDCPDS